MYSSFVGNGHQLNSFNLMWNQANKTVIQASGQSVSVVTKNTRKGHFWSYDQVNTFYGPFENYTTMKDDCITYSEHGTINDSLIKC